MAISKIGTSSIDGLGYGFKNRLINGNMVLDQRNAGASVTVTTANPYTLDRWQAQASQSSKFTVQQNAGSVTPPLGFTNYLGVTSSSAYSLTGNDFFQIAQIVEGFNIADFGWGTANAQPASLSFWVRSSLTGTFGGSLATAGSGVWVLPFSYVINSANTWTYITVAIPAGTSALTNNNNSAGIYVRFGLGSAGTSAGGTAGTWTNAGNFIQPAGSTSVVGTNGATFYITGVQLEKGSAATSYDVRSYGTELQLCQRYYQKLVDPPMRGVGTSGTSGGASRLALFLPVPMRATPTVSTTGTFTFWNGSSATTGSVMSGYWVGGNSNVTGIDMDISIASSYPVGQAVCAYLSGDTTRWVALNSEL